jgi:YbbR domain-containing protein
MSDRFVQILHGISRNKGAKLIALLLALITWYVIQPAISFESTISDVPVRVQVDPGWAVLEQSVGSVDVHFRGSREGLRYLDQEQLEVVADARGLSYTESLTMPLELRGVRRPAGVRPIYIRPAEVMLTVDQEDDIELPVRVVIQGNPPEGYEVEEFKAVPESVLVSGPRQRLGAIEEIRTTPIDMEGRLQSFKLRVGLVPPSRTWIARLEPERVEVEVRLVERSSSLTLDDMRIYKLFGAELPAGVEMQPTHATVSLIGRVELLDALTRRDIRLYADLSGMLPGETEEVPILAHLPARVRIDQISPQTVTVRMPPATPLVLEDADLAPEAVAETGEEGEDEGENEE